MAPTAPSRALISITGALHVVVPIREYLNTAWPHHQPLGQAATRVRVGQGNQITSAHAHDSDMTFAGAGHSPTTSHMLEASVRNRCARCHPLVSAAVASLHGDAGQVQKPANR